MTSHRLTTVAKMGRVRTKTVKRSAKVIIERYYPSLTLDFSINKRRCDEIALIPSKRLRNKVKISPPLYFWCFKLTAMTRLLDTSRT